MSKDIITIENVHGYVDEAGTVFLNIEDVARGLGFVKTEEKVSPISGRKIYESVRWERINGYLAEYGYPPVKAGDFIPENIFYLLAMKANSATAKTFQLKVANEILPSIRKTGMYINPQATISPEFLRQVADALEAATAKVRVLETQIIETQPLVDYCNVILQCTELVTTSIIAKDYGYSAKKFNKLLHEFAIQFKQSGTWLPYQKYAAQGWTQTKTHKYVGSDAQIHCRVHTYWTQKGRLGLYHMLKENCILPLIERTC